MFNGETVKNYCAELDEIAIISKSFHKSELPKKNVFSISWCQVFATLAAALGSTAVGAAMAYTATALPDLRKEKSFGHITPTHETWISSLMLLAGIVGAPTGGALIDWIGRRGTLIASMPIFVGGWVLIIFAQNIEMIYAGRFITGLAAGVSSLAVPVFISEISSPEIRGALTSCFDLSLTIGILYIYIFGAWLNWKYQAIVCSILPILCGILLFFVHESPFFLNKKGKTKLAKISSNWYNTAEEPVDSLSLPSDLKMNLEQGSANKVKNSCWQDVLTFPVLKPLSIALFLVMFYEGSGIIPITAYTVDIFAAAGTEIDDNLSAILVGFLQVVATLISALTVDRFGRRILLLVSEGVIVMSMIGLSTYFYLKSHPSFYSVDHLSWLPLASFLLYIVAFSIGVGPIVWIYLGEILPLNFRGKGSGIVVTFSYVAAFVLTLKFGDLMQTVGYDGGYILIGAVCFVGFCYVYFCVPETKGKSLDEIQALFN